MYGDAHQMQIVIPIIYHPTDAIVLHTVSIVKM